MLNYKKNDVFLLLGIFTISLIYGILFFRIDGDVMWHFKTGEFIIANRLIPYKDIFSWQPDLNWMCHEWLYDIALYFAYFNFGELGARAALYIALSLPLLISYCYNRRKIQHPYIFLLFIVLIMTFWNSSRCARPSEFSIVFLLLSAIIMVEDYKYKNITFFLCCVVAANVHGGSIAQLLIIPVLCLISDIIVWVLKRERITTPWNTFIIGFIGTLINPYGISIYKYTIDIFFKAKFINSHIMEWQANTISIVTAILILGITLILGAAKEFRTFERKEIQKYIIMFAFLCLGLATRRMMFNAACILMLFSYEYLERFFSEVLANMDLSRLSKTIFCKCFIYLRRFSGIVYSLLGLTIITLLCYTFTISGKETYINLIDKSYPELTSTMDYMKKNDINGSVFHNYNIGGNLILHNIKTFIDPRCDPFIEDFSNTTSLRDYFTYLDAKDTSRYEAWTILRDKYSFKYALLDLTNNTDRELSQWLKIKGEKVLYENKKSVLYQLK